MGMEQWAAAASIVFFVMFVAGMASIYHFMQQTPEDEELVFEPDPMMLLFITIGAEYTLIEQSASYTDPRILKIIFVGAFPGATMAAVSFILSRRYGSRRVGMLIVAGGAALLAGMSYCYSISDSIHEVYVTTFTWLIPPLFMVVSVPVMVFGALLFRIRTRKPRKDYL